MQIQDISTIKAIISKYINDIDAWKFREINCGVVSKKYKVEINGELIFVKCIRENEKYVIKFLIQYYPQILEKILYPPLIDDNILVCEYLAGRHINKEVNENIINKYIEMQSILNKKNVKEKWVFPSNLKYDKIDRNYYKQKIIDNFYDCYYNLKNLNDMYCLNKLYNYIEICDKLKVSILKIANDYSDMPFAWLHNDFKKENIIQTKDRQQIVDWGSSYGYGPFIHDLCIYLQFDLNRLYEYINELKIHFIDKSKLLNCLYSAIAARFIEFCKYRLSEREGFITSPNKLNVILEFHWKFYRCLKSYY